MRAVRTTAVAVSLVVVMGIAGCASASTPTVRVAPSSTAAPTPTSVPTPTPTPTPRVFLGTGISLSYSCDELVDPTVIDSLDAKLRVNESYVPAPTTSAEQATAIKGTACQWSDAKTGTTLIVTAANPDPPTLQKITSTTAAYATPTTMFGNNVTGYVSNNQVEIFTRSGYWATASSALFSNLDAARTVMTAVEQSLPIG